MKHYFVNFHITACVISVLFCKRVVASGIVFGRLCSLRSKKFVNFVL